MDMREKLMALPYSYDDFVDFTMQCIEQEKGVKEAVEKQFSINPNSDTNDITEVVWRCLGIDEAVELIDDTEMDIKVAS